MSASQTSTAVSAHALLALGGLVVWSAYLTSDISRLAWTAALILAVVIVAVGVAVIFFSPRRA